MGQRDTETRDFIIKIPTEELQVWEVFFDNQDQNADTDGARRLDPLVFDLNRDGKLDTTDGSQLGNGKMDGESVLFDIDPSRKSVSGWTDSSPTSPVTMKVGTIPGTSCTWRKSHLQYRYRREHRQT